MTTPRITQRSMMERSFTAMQAAQARVAAVQEQLSTGRVINRPSDSPTGTNTALRLRSELGEVDQSTRNAQNGLGWLGTVDTQLTSAIDTVNRIRVIAVQASNTGTLSPEAAEAYASEVAQLREELLSVANTTYLGRPVFGGTTSGGVAYDASGAYVGDDGQVLRRIDSATQVRVDSSGPAVFGDGADSLFATIDTLVTNLRTNPAGIASDLDGIDAATSRLKNAVTDAGTRTVRLEGVVDVAQKRTIELQASLSEVEDVDLAKAILDLSMQEVAYQAALGATARVLQPSLLDFLR